MHTISLYYPFIFVYVGHEVFYPQNSLWPWLSSVHMAYVVVLIRARRSLDMCSLCISSNITINNASDSWFSHRSCAIINSNIHQRLSQKYLESITIAIRLLQRHSAMLSDIILPGSKSRKWTQSLSCSSSSSLCKRVLCTKSRSFICVDDERIVHKVNIFQLDVFFSFISKKVYPISYVPPPFVSGESRNEYNSNNT